MVGPHRRAAMLTIYIEEAHAEDEWLLPDAQRPIRICQPTTTQERCDIAKRFIADTGFRCPMVVDTITGEANDAYRADPERLFIVVDGAIVYHGGPGPFGYRLAEVEDWLEAHVGNGK